MAEKLTAQQLQAVENRGGKLLVSAAAGSGKTKVLVDRLMRYILDTDAPANIDDFLIITYTKAAAAELRGKIAAKLSELIAEEPTNRHLQQQLQRLYLAKISTVHGFCADVLRQYAYRLDITGDFRVAEESECVEFQLKAIEQTLDDAYENAANDGDFRALIDSQGLGRDDRLIPQIILKVYASAKCHRNPEQWLNWCVSGVSADVTGAEQTPWGAYLIADLKSYLALQVDAITRCATAAAMSDSRRSGYLYVGLKPSNIFVTEQGQYKIGGLGFIKLDSLKYMSLPEKSRSIYTPAEINDAFATLNTTIDIYAIGMILYQAYNNGELPFNEEVVPGHKLPPPLYADYEMSEIILKACSPNPAERWQEPVQMGQAIVEYMQRNGALDEPIVPSPTPEVADIEEAPAVDCEDVSVDAEDIPAEAMEIAVETDEQLHTDSAQDTDADDGNSTHEEDALENLTFLTDVTMEDLELTGEKADYEELTGEVTEILNQADELSTLSVPEPVNVPEHVELPELPAESEPEETETEGSVDSQTDGDEENADVSAVDNEENSDEILEDELFEEKPKKRNWGRTSVITLLIAALLAVGYYLYQQYYILHIDSILLNGADNSLTVHIRTEADETLLKVICVDPYGNQIIAPVTDGKAEFNDLLYSTAYNIKIVSDNHRKIAGIGNINYSTPIQSNIVRFEAITGATDGSVILDFTIDGPDSAEWTVHYSTKGEEERTSVTTSHRAIIDGLTIGKEYTFRLVPKDALHLYGQNEIKYTARKVLKAENLEIVSCIDNQLVVKWDAPAGEKVKNWKVSCTGGNYYQTYNVTETTATFKDLDHTANFVIEVIAENMSEGAKTDIAANTATVTDFKADNSKANTLKLTWNTSIPVPVTGWKLHYTIVGINQKKTITCNENEASITPIVPNATYHIWLTSAMDTPLLNASLEAKTGGAPDYNQKVNNVTLKRTDLRFHMCKANTLLEWDGESLEDLEFISTFSTGEIGTFIVEIAKDIEPTKDSIAIQYVIRNKESAPIFYSTTTTTLAQMQIGNNYKLQMPPMPTSSGTYTIEVYFNNELAATQKIKIS